VPALRFDAYQRWIFSVERDAHHQWIVYEISHDGKRRVRADLVIPAQCREDEIATYLDDLLHECARPGQRVKRIS
jgi:hypothetical protein